MKAWRVYEPQKMQLDNLESQTATEGTVKLKILVASVSPSEVSVFQGRTRIKNTPRIMGRACVAMVTEVGENVTNVSRGDTVVLDTFTSCGVCLNCRNSKSAECEKPCVFGVHQDGFLRDFAVVPSANLFKIPERIKDTDAIFLQSIAIAINLISRLNIEKGEHLVIVGADELGLILAQVAMYYQAVPILVDTRQDRLNLAAQNGVYYTINSVEMDTKSKIFSITGGRMAENVAFSVDSTLPLFQSFDYTAKNGHFAIFGYPNTGIDLVTANLNNVFFNQISLYMVNSTGKNISSAINILANKAINLTGFLSKEIPLNEVGKNIQEQIDYPGKYLSVVMRND